MSIKVNVLTTKGLNVNALLNDVGHISETVPHGSTKFDAIDNRDHLTAHVTGSGFHYLAGIPISGTVTSLTVDKGSAHQLKVDFTTGIKVTSLLSPSKLAAYFTNQQIIFTGNNGNDVITSKHGADILKGGKGNDSLDGDLGNDRLEGGIGNDHLAGDNGKDLLIGGVGKDTMIGGFDADRFIFNTLADSVVGAQHDTIADFHHSQGDKINLHAIDANTGLAGNQDFVFIGALAFSGTPGEVRYAGGLLQANVNANPAADFEVHLNGVASLVTGDLIL
jgi:Ca2+-binding RTX toxin-like protein